MVDKSRVVYVLLPKEAMHARIALAAFAKSLRETADGDAAAENER